MNIFKKVQQYYIPIHDSILVQKHTMTKETVFFIHTELQDKSFIKEELHRLLQKPEYISISCKNITINYIPIARITQARMKTLITRLLTLTKMFQIENVIQYWILPCNTKRFFPHTGIVEAKNINGGYTYTHNQTIFIYRYEEFPKVAIHELLHNSILHVDQWNKEDLLSLYQAFHIDTDSCDIYCTTQLMPNEALIEAWSIMFHLCFVAIETKQSFQELYEQELSYSLSISHKLLEYQQKMVPLWKENTHSYSYIRLKTCILFYWKSFEKIHYPYRSQVLTRFFLEHNAKKTFLKQILNSPLPTDPGFRMTRSGDL